MINGRQIRAARALLDMSQDELAQAAGLTPQAIRKIESGHVMPREGTIADITKVFDERSVEFIDGRGAALKNDEIASIMDPNAFMLLLDDVITTLKGKNEVEALFACVSDSLSPPIVIENYRRLRNANIKMRSLIKEGDTYLMGSLEEYRYLPSAFFHNNATVIYADKFATMILDPITGHDIGVVIIRNLHIAQAQRNLFNLIWHQGAKPQKTSAEEKYDG